MSSKVVSVREKPLIQGIWHDITARKQAEAERSQLLVQVRQQAQRVRQIMDSVPEGVLLLDAQGRILLANRVAERDLAVLAGAKLGDVLTHLGDRPLPELLAPSPVGWHEVQAGPRTFEAIARTMEGDPETDLWVMVFNDVTDERAQRQYQQAEAQLASVGQMAAGIAHDFNNIMGAIVLYVQMLRKAPDLSPKHQQHLAVIHDQARHATNLIRQILDFSRRAILQRNPIDLLPFANELVKMLERTLPENIELAINYDRNEYVVNADPTRLQQILMNLALNARDAMPNGGRLGFAFTTLDLAPDQRPPLPDMAAGEWMRLAVSDTGAGISPEHSQHIFEPFFTTKQPGKGTGLGLAQVYGIVKQHGGFIGMESRIGQGTTFTLYLPLFNAPPTPALSTTAVPEVVGGSETILLVEDNPDMRMSVVLTLEGLGYQVLAAADGEEALSLIAQQAEGAIALVLSDLVMPRMGGVKLYQALKSQQPALKMIIMTGHIQENEGRELLELGIVHWIQKPFTAEQIAAKLRGALDAAQNQAG